MSTGVNPSPLANPSNQKSRERKLANLRSTIGIGMVVAIASVAALMFGLFHELGTHESVIVVFVAAAMAGGIAYTIYSFLKTPG